MEENRYPEFEEEAAGSLRAEEPVGGAVHVMPVNVEPTFAMPAGVPHSVEAAMADIDEGERQFVQGKTFTHKEVMQMVWDKINCYAG